jgi:hypothetical protein
LEVEGWLHVDSPVSKHVERRTGGIRDRVRPESVGRCRNLEMNWFLRAVTTLFLKLRRQMGAVKRVWSSSLGLPPGPESNGRPVAWAQRLQREYRGTRARVHDGQVIPLKNKGRSLYE